MVFPLSFSLEAYSKKCNPFLELGLKIKQKSNRIYVFYKFAFKGVKVIT